MEVKELWYDRLYFPKKSNHKVVEDYLTSKLVTRQLPKLKECGDNICRDVRVSCYLAQQELYDTKKRLASKRKLAIEMRKSLDAQWADLSKKEEELRQSFIKFNQFVKENEEKRERASAKMGEQNLVVATRRQEIDVVTYECDEIEYIQRCLEEAIIKNQIYEQFLDSVVEKYPAEFHDSSEVLKRYATLKHTKEALLNHQKKDMMRLDEARLESDKLIKSYCVKLAGLKTRLADLHQRHESTKMNAQNWEKLLLNIRSEATDKVTELVAIKESCWRIYKEMCERKGIEPAFKDDYGKQLDFIKKVLYEFESVNNMVRALEEEKMILSERPCVSDGTELLSGFD